MLCRGGSFVERLVAGTFAAPFSRWFVINSYMPTRKGNIADFALDR
jgi:hypothetical protein